MTYNVWFDAHNKDNRYEAIIQMILMSNANVVCLQECTTIFLSKLVNNKQIRAKFKHYGFQNFTTFYGVAIISQWPPANMYEYTYPLKFEGDEAPRSEITLSSKSSNYESEIEAS